MPPPFPPPTQTDMFGYRVANIFRLPPLLAASELDQGATQFTSHRGLASAPAMLPAGLLAVLLTSGQRHQLAGDASSPPLLHCCDCIPLVLP